MTDVVFTLAVLVAVVALAVAGRFLAGAWRDVRLGRERRSGGDRRRHERLVPIERRAGERRN